jgi:nitroreductase
VKGDAHWDDYVSALLPFNATWASNAAALVFILSDTLIAAPGSTEYKPAGTNSFDAGAAWGYLALQATRLGLATHAMAGFDAARAGEITGAGERYKVEVAVAIGRRGDPRPCPRRWPRVRRPALGCRWRRSLSMGHLGKF